MPITVFDFVDLESRDNIRASRILEQVYFFINFESRAKNRASRILEQVLFSWTLNLGGKTELLGF